MKQFFLVIATFFSLISSTSYAREGLENDILIQLQSQGDSSIVDSNDNKFYLDVEKILIDKNGIHLCSDFFGLVALSNLMQDNTGVYTTGWYCYYECDSCGYRYWRPPGRCDNCGGSSFTLIN